MNRTHNWKGIWGIKPKFATPRDIVARLKAQHRNLHVAKHGGYPSTTCTAQGCHDEESQLHLVECQHINAGFWVKIEKLLETLGLPAENHPSFWILGELQNGRIACAETQGILCLAWRALYAETVKAHLDDQPLRIQHAYFHTVRYVISRAKAYGQKWKTWYNAQRYHHNDRLFPEKHRKHAIIKLDERANYTIHRELEPEFQRARPIRPHSN